MHRRTTAIVALAALALSVTTAPVAAQEEEVTHQIVSGAILLPEGTILPDDASVDVAVQDTALADAPAVTIAALSMAAPGGSSPIPFAMSYLPVALDEMGQYTLGVRVETDDGSLLYINDTFTPAIDDSGPIGNIVVELVAVE